jgi:hypothetical protein
MTRLLGVADLRSEALPWGPSLLVGSESGVNQLRLDPRASMRCLHNLYKRSREEIDSTDA